jgi:hypothetical protein
MRIGRPTLDMFWRLGSMSSTRQTVARRFGTRRRPITERISRQGQFEFRRWRHILVASAGGLAMALMLSLAFGRFYGGL